MARLMHSVLVVALCAAVVSLLDAPQPAVAQSKQSAASPAAPGVDKKAHRLILQVNTNEPAVMNLALNNAANAEQHYKSIGEKVQIEIVAFGPGLNMLRDDTSPFLLNTLGSSSGSPASLATITEPPFSFGCPGRHGPCRSRSHRTRRRFRAFAGGRTRRCARGFLHDTCVANLSCDDNGQLIAQAGLSGEQIMPVKRYGRGPRRAIRLDQHIQALEKCAFADIHGM